MSSYQDVCSHGKNPAITEKQRSANWLMIRGLTFGLMLGIMIRVGWDQGIIAMYVLVLKDLGAAIWTMLRDTAAASWDFFQFAFR